MAGAGGHGQVGDGSVLGLAGTGGDYRQVAALLGQADGFQRLSQGANLVELDEDGVGDAGVRAPRQTLRVGGEQVVANKLG